MEKESLNKQLFSAARHNDLEQAKLLIEKGADVKAKDKYGDTPLYYAVRYNNVEVAELLIEQGADINVKNKWGKTPLHMAVTLNNLKIVELLIENQLGFKKLKAKILKCWLLKKKTQNQNLGFLTGHERDAFFKALIDARKQITQEYYEIDPADFIDVKVAVSLNKNKGK